jgi:hypothetical protein
LGKRMLAAGFDLFFETLDLNKLHRQTHPPTALRAHFGMPWPYPPCSGLTELDGSLHDGYIYSLRREYFGASRTETKT